MLTTNTMTFFAPVAQKMEEKANPEKGAMLFRVLVVDDVRSIRQIVRKQIEGLGLRKGAEGLKFEVEEAENGQEAVNRIKGATAGKGFAAVIMDIDMPVKNGYEATQEILSFNSQLPIIAYTSIPEKECLEKQPLFAAYIPKAQTFKIAQLLLESVSSPKPAKKNTLSASPSLDLKDDNQNRRSPMVEANRSSSEEGRISVISVSSTSSPSSISATPSPRAPDLLSLSIKSEPPSKLSLSSQLRPVDSPTKELKSLEPATEYSLEANTSSKMAPIASHLCIFSPSLPFDKNLKVPLPSGKSHAVSSQSQEHKQQELQLNDLSTFTITLQDLSHSGNGPVP